MKKARMLKEGARQLGLELEAGQIGLFGAYFDELKKWNKKAGLTSIVEEEEVISGHFLDSLSCLASNRIGPFSNMIDLGAGAGLPGIPLKIVYPSLSLTLIDSSKKKARFLEFLVKRLGLDGTEVVCQRAEEFAQVSSNRESYDIVVTRAVAGLPVLLEYSLPLLKSGGLLIAQKGKIDPKELEQGRKAASIMGGKIDEVINIDVPFLVGERHLIIAEKQAATPLEFPRRPGVPGKRPLGQD